MPIRGTICSYLFVATGQQKGLDFKAPSRLIQRICFSAALNNFTFQVPDISEVVPQLPLHYLRMYFELDEIHEVLDRLRILVS
ncbi:hypothetical protein CK203_060246 [Vitis vinifera]|uniref:Uncharacterized protein n=1 Tax=Vitis vinifera TaxID=29760 RepID=A0A438GLM9_VITVI|nr:hypothetical protein CK203_060246 [Vitis vinifera]